MDQTQLEAMFDIQQRLEAGELKHLMNLDTSIPSELPLDPDQSCFNPYWMQNLRARYGSDGVVTGPPFNSETMTTQPWQNFTGVYVTAKAFEAANSPE